MVYNRIRLTQWMTILLSCVLLLGANLTPTQAAPAAPVVSYNPNNQTVVIGTSPSATPGTEVLTFAELKAALDGQGGGGALVDQGGGIWLLKIKIFVNASASVQFVKTASFSELRLDSVPANPVFIQIEQRGHFLLDGVKVSSWDSIANKVDENTGDGRSYIDATDGARLDVLNSDVGYLGSSTSPPYGGLTWRKRLPGSVDPTTGATGRVENSKIHHNMVGLYVSLGYGLKIANTEIFNNQAEGLLVKDASSTIEVSGNTVHDNGADGMNFVGSMALTISTNKVYANARQGILLESASNGNTVTSNEAYNHAAGDGIAVATSNNNTISGNNSHNNKNGIRVSGNASTMATGNQILNNTVTANENGINLYGHGDRNTISGNQVSQNTGNGIYIKSGGNRLEKNIVNNANATGIGISADTPDGLAGAEVSGSNNVIVGSTVTGNVTVGIKITGGANNRIGQDLQAPNPADSNLIEGNGTDGISLSSSTSSGVGATDTLVFSNTIRANKANGVSIRDATTLRNRITRNLITLNESNAIKVNPGTQGGIAAPVITAVLADNEVQGTAVAGGTVEVYTDPAGQAQNFWGSATVGGDGKWKFPLPVGQDPKRVTALVIDQSGNTSAVSARSGSTAGPFYKVENDEAGQKTIFATGNGSTVTLNSIKTGLGAANTNLLNDLGNGVWELNANMMIAAGVTLDLSQAVGVKELRLRSQATVTAAEASAAPNVFDPASFVYLRTHDGALNIDGVKIYSWNGSGPDTDITNGRAYIIAKYTAQMFISNAEISYLGSDASTETFGVTWRDSNDPASPGVLRTRVTGQVQDSKFHHNYIGVYAIQAQNMVFRNNEFFNNLRYGFLGDDFSHDFLVENNQAHDNASHGFIISRGVKLFTVKGNKSFNNTDAAASASVAHGFVLDPGSATPDIPSTPSTENTFENNEAYNNEGLGMRIVGCNNNIIRNNRFFQNLNGGISVELNSTGNTIEGNQLTDNQSNGIVLRNTADGNIVATNVISKNVDNGLYVRSSNNTLTGNIIGGNLKAGVAFTPEPGASALQNNQLLANTVTGNGTSGIDVRGATGTKIEGNTAANNTQHGIYLTDGATNNLVARNEVRNNTGHGIRCSGLAAFGNKWSENRLYGNTAGGLAVTDNANSNIGAAVSLSVKERVLTGSAKPDSTVEIFTDDNSQGRYYQGSATVQADGKFTFTLISGKWQGAQITTVVIDAQGNSSVFSNGILAPDVPDNVFMPLVRR